jgi:hypothetical protein
VKLSQRVPSHSTGKRAATHLEGLEQQMLGSGDSAKERAARGMRESREAGTLEYVEVSQPINDDGSLGDVSAGRYVDRE